jgi:hypothetical protein
MLRLSVTSVHVGTSRLAGMDGLACAIYGISCGCTYALMCGRRLSNVAKPETLMGILSYGGGGEPASDL